MLRIPIFTIFIYFFFSSLAFSDSGFLRFIDDFSTHAYEHGISKQTYKRAFRGIRTPDRDVIRKANYQPEFRLQLWQYLDTRIDDFSIIQGRKYRIRYRDVLEELENQYGVSQEILLAIWSMESSYGAMLKHNTLSIIRSLSTLAYLDDRRSKFARNQLLAALRILQMDLADIDDLTGSWAGAMGHTQFIPTSYLLYARDGDGDGTKDVWHSVPDALASAANLLKTNGWRSGETWGYEVTVPKKLYKRVGDTRTIAEWESSGIKRVRDRQFTGKDRNAILHFPSGTSGPAFLMLRNFYVLKTYNNADKYALAVGHLADRIAGGPEFSRSLPRPHVKLNLLQRMELQRYLRRHGFYEGKIDGKIGPESRNAILKAQEEFNLPTSGYATKKLLISLKSK